MQCLNVGWSKLLFQEGLPVASTIKYYYSNVVIWYDISYLVQGKESTGGLAITCCVVVRREGLTRYNLALNSYSSC